MPVYIASCFVGLPVDDDLFLQAVRAGKYRLINQILTTGSTLDINQKDSSGQTALLIAIQLPDYEIRNNFVKLLCKFSGWVGVVSEWLALMWVVGFVWLVWLV